LKSLSIRALLQLFILPGVNARGGEWEVTGRNFHAQAWERTALELDTVTGRTVQRHHSYVELATGLNYQKDGQWIADTGEFSWTSSATYNTNGLNDLQVWELRSNVQVNDPAQDFGSNTNTQFETTLVAFGNTVICAWVDSNLGVTGFGQSDPRCDPSWSSSSVPRFIGWAVSRDGGVSFADRGAPPPLTNIVNSTTNVLGDAGDPVLARDTNTGIIYLVGNPQRPSLYYPDGTNNPKVYLPLWRSTNNGESFLPPVNALPIVAGAVDDIFDKPAMAIDNSPGTGQGDIYVATKWQSTSNWLVFNRADQGGTNWSTNLVRTIGGSTAQRPALAIKTNHDVCLIWVESETIKFAKSTDRGTNFTAPTNVVSLIGGFGLKRHNLSAPLDSFNAFIVPTLVANPANEHLYVIYHDQLPGITNTPNILFVQSTNARELGCTHQGELGQPDEPSLATGHHGQTRWKQAFCLVV